MQLGQRFRRTFIGDRVFYGKVAHIVAPVLVQMVVTNLVNLLDNIMVGRLYTEAISGVAVGSQLVFVFNLCIFGGLSGPSIFGAQYFGARDLEGVRDTFRLKLWTIAILLVLGIGVYLGFGKQLISGYLKGDGDPKSAELILQHGLDYLHIMMLGFLPFALTTAYAGTLRESGETTLPMIAGIIAVFTNLLGNWLLIYGNLGFPKLGVQGAALGTVISRFVELGIILYAMHKGGRYEFMRGIYLRLKVPFSMVKAVFRKGLPLLINEFLWSLGMATLMQVYSLRGLNVLAAFNIAYAVNNLFNIVFISMGNAIAVLVGQSLGANDMERARGDVWRLMFLSVTFCLVVGLVMALLAPYFPLLYNTTDDVRELATGLLITLACFMPVYAISHCSFFTLRSGGSTLLTFLFDSAFMWVLAIPFTYALAHWTAMPILVLYPVSEAASVLKLFVGLWMVRKGVWIRNIVHKPEPV